MRIRFLIRNAYARGGTVRTTLDTASRLASRHDVEVVSLFRHVADPVYRVDERVRIRPLVDRREYPGQWGPLTRRLSRLPSLIEPRGARRDPRLSLLSDIRLARDIRSMRSGLLIGTRPSLNLAIARLARPSVYTLGQEHQYLGLWDPWLQDAMRRAYPRLDAVTGLTPADARRYREVLPPGVLVRDMPNAVPDVGDARSDLSSSVVVSAGRLTPQKGFDLLIEAFRIVADRHPAWSLHIYGVGPRRQQLARQLRASGLKGTVVLKGFSGSLPEALAGASIFALSSRFEGFSLALVEAMGVGLPPVAFAAPHGPLEIITDEVDGLLVPPENVEALAAGICALIEDPQRRAELGAAACRRVQSYAPELVDARWDRLIDDLTARPSGVRRGVLARLSR